MQPPNLEPEMEALLHRVHPGFDDQVEGASPEEIAAVRAIVGQPLPHFYEWFLSRMGRSMGPFAYPRHDFSASRVIWCYDQGLATPDPEDLLIGYDASGDPADLHLFYDFTQPCRNDAGIGKGEPDAGPVYPRFETFRELLAWGLVLTHVVMTSRSYCNGIVRSLTHLNAVDQLRQFMLERGFEQPVPTGDHCAIFMRTDMTMICYRGLLVETDNTAFRLGGQSQAWLRRFLGEIALSDEMELDENSLEWGGSQG
ncbi:SMI1/KNR4 family protein [Enhygromyxa salina]|uniref:SMI1/KNR4 family protein n=1 Tax=Enhygromyxa salina TaxID=215803 RepID=UPI0013FD042C|nr:SMI1/KNR4 family protein [Enhygromyxa salina]